MPVDGWYVRLPRNLGWDLSKSSSHKDVYLALLYRPTSLIVSGFLYDFVGRITGSKKLRGT